MIHNMTSVFLLLLTSMVVMFSSESISASDAELIVDAGPDLNSWDAVSYTHLTLPTTPYV